MKILVICLTRLGDIVESTSMLKGLKLRYPDSRIAYMLQKKFSPAAKVIPCIEKVIEFDYEKIYQKLFYESRNIEDAYQYLDGLFKEIRDEQYDRIIQITPNNIGIFSAFLSDIDPKSCEQGSGWLNYFYSVTNNWHTLPFHFCDMFAKIAGIETTGIKPEVKISDKAVEWAECFLKSHHVAGDIPLVGFNPGASHDVKQWRKEYFIETGKMILNRYRVHLILYGSDSERELCEEIRTGIGDAGIINAAGNTDIEQFASLLRKTDVLITNDTGSMHLASACGTKIISFHTGKEKCFSTGPYGEGHIAIQAGLPCHPCNNPDICGSKQCRDVIKPDLVYAVFEKMISGESDFKGLSRNSNVHQSRIDETGMVDYVPPGRPVLTPKTFNRYMLKMMLNRCLSPHTDNELERRVLRGIGQSYDCIDNSLLTEHRNRLKQQLESLMSLCEAGIAAANGLKNLGKNPANHIHALEKLSAEIEQTDCRIIGRAESINGFETLAHLFRSEKNGLRGDDILVLAQQTEEIYLKLKTRCMTIITLCRDFFNLNNITEKEVYHEHFSQRNTHIFAA